MVGRWGGVPALVAVLACSAFGYPLQLFWFKKIAAGLIKVLTGGGKAKAK